MYVGKILVATALALSSTASFADPLENANFYLGAGYTSAKLIADGTDDVEQNAAQVKIGTQLDPFISIEGRMTAGVGGKKVDVINGMDGSLGLDSAFGAYLRFNREIGTRLNPYVLFGFSRVKGEYISTEGNSTGRPVSLDATGLSMAAGTEIKLNQNISASVEAARIYNSSSVNVDGISIGLISRF